MSQSSTYSCSTCGGPGHNRRTCITTTITTHHCHPTSTITAPKTRKQKHKWTEDDLMKVFKVCELHQTRTERMKHLQREQCLHDCSEASINMQILRYQCRKDNKMEWDPSRGIKQGWGANSSGWDRLWANRTQL